MKFLASILAICILFLAVKPGIDALYSIKESGHACCAGSCDSDKDADGHSNPEKNCGSNSCNPFQVCSSCSGLLFTTAFEYLHINSSASEKIMYDADFVNQRHLTDIWQPPRKA